MELLVMRHGDAEDSKDDFHRRLTSLGRDEARDAALALADRDFKPEVIYARRCMPILLVDVTSWGNI
jgi:phosphohistidine phosphatase SixA